MNSLGLKHGLAVQRNMTPNKCVDAFDGDSQLPLKQIPAHKMAPPSNYSVDRCQIPNEVPN